MFLLPTAHPAYTDSAWYVWELQLSLSTRTCGSGWRGMLVTSRRGMSYRRRGWVSEEMRSLSVWINTQHRQPSQWTSQTHRQTDRQTNRQTRNLGNSADTWTMHRSSRTFKNKSESCASVCGWAFRSSAMLLARSLVGGYRRLGATYGSQCGYWRMTRNVADKRRFDAHWYFIVQIQSLVRVRL